MGEGQIGLVICTCKMRVERRRSEITERDDGARRLCRAKDVAMEEMENKYCCIKVLRRRRYLLSKRMCVVLKKEKKKNQSWTRTRRHDILTEIVEFSLPALSLNTYALSPG